MTYRVLDLFAGAGGFSYGFSLVLNNDERKAFEIVKAVEIDSDACKTLRHHLETDNQKNKKVVYEGDLTKDKVKNELINELKGKIDIIIGGPPCQTFSLAGPSRSGSKEMREALKYDKRNILFKHYLELVEKIEPKFIVFENVEGITSKDSSDFFESNTKNKKVIELICDELEFMGYKVNNTKKQRYMVLNAAEYGVPQERRRVFIVANNLDSKVENPVPIPEYGEGKSYPFITLNDAIGDLPALLPRITIRSFKKLKKIGFVKENYFYCLKKLLKKLRDSDGSVFAKEKMKKIDDLLINELLYCESNSITYQRMIEFTEKLNILFKKLSVGSEYINIKDLKSREKKEFRNYIRGNSKSLTMHRARTHNLRDIIIFSLMTPGTTSAHFFNKNNKSYSDKKIKQNLRKLYPYDSDKHVDTYVKHDPDRPSKTILAHLAKDGLRFIHPYQPRTFTPREAARLQSFPDSFCFYGPMTSQFRQIGNAVPPLLAKEIGKAIYNRLEKI